MVNLGAQGKLSEVYTGSVYCYLVFSFSYVVLSQILLHSQSPPNYRKFTVYY